MATGTQVIVRQTSDSDVREYLVSEPVCEVLYARYHQPLHGADESFSELGEIGEQIARALMDPAQVDTIEKIAFRPFSITVHKSPTASWSRIESLSIVPALKESLGEQELDIRHESLVGFRELKVRGLERMRAS